MWAEMSRPTDWSVLNRVVVMAAPRGGGPRYGDGNMIERRMGGVFVCVVRCSIYILYFFYIYRYTWW